MQIGIFYTYPPTFLYFLSADECAFMLVIQLHIRTKTWDLSFESSLWKELLEGYRGKGVSAHITKDKPVDIKDAFLVY